MITRLNFSRPRTLRCQTYAKLLAGTPVYPARWLSAACILMCCLLSSPLLAQTIRADEENGRKIFVNDGAAPAPKATAGQPSRTYVYWSNAEKRWKLVPVPSASVLRRARAAASEVEGLVETPAKGGPATVLVKTGGSASGSSPAASTPIANPNARPLALTHAASPLEIDRIIEESAARHHVDPKLVRAIIKVESNFNPAAVSRKGAMGLMQLMPATARTFNVSNPFDPRQNVEAGVQHLKKLLDNFKGDVTLTLAAYNAGSGAVTRNQGVPPYAETRNYVRRIGDLYSAAGTSLASSGPIHVSRNALGVLTLTNVD